MASRSADSDWSWFDFSVVIRRIVSCCGTFAYFPSLLTDGLDVHRIGLEGDQRQGQQAEVELEQAGDDVHVLH